MQHHTAPICALALFPEGIIASAGSSDMTVKLWNRSGAQIGSLPIQTQSNDDEDSDEITSVLALSNNRLVIGTWNTLQIWDISTKQQIFSKELLSMGKFLFPLNNQGFACSMDKYITLYNERGNEQRPLRLNADVISFAAISDDYFAMGLTDNTLLLCNTKTNVLKILHRATERIISLVLYQGCLVGAAGTTLKIWDLSTGVLLRFYDTRAPIYSLLAIPGAIVYGTNFGTMGLWDVASNQTKTWQAHTAVVSALVYSNDVITSGSWDKSIKQWCNFGFQHSASYTFPQLTASAEQASPHQTPVSNESLYSHAMQRN